MNTHETYVSLETAKLLKKSGFDWNIYDGYILYEDGVAFVTKFQTLHNFNGNNGELFNNYLHHKEILSRPTLVAAQRWLREEKNFILEVEFSNTGHNWFLRYCDVTVHGMSDGHWHNIGDRSGYKTYEDALEEGLKISLELITTDYGLHREK